MKKIEMNYIFYEIYCRMGRIYYSDAVKRGTLDKLETLDYICEDDENKNEEYLMCFNW